MALAESEIGAEADWRLSGRVYEVELVGIEWGANPRDHII